MPIPLRPPRRAVFALAATLLLGGCSSLISIDFTPRIKPLEEETVEGSRLSSSKILLLDLSGLLQEDTPSLSLTTPPPPVPLLDRVREELRRASVDN